MEERDDINSTIQRQIDEIATTSSERAEAERILLSAFQQSQLKEIKINKKTKPLKKFFVLWKIRFKYGIHWRKPLYLFRIIKNVSLGKMYDMLGIKKFVLRGIEFAVTFKCNFKCSHCLCSRLEESDRRRELTPQDYKRIVQDAMSLGATTFGLEGGEPFIKKDWEDIVKSWKPHYNHIIISTNGYLFDEEKAKKCMELGVDTINFSLDSGKPELHNAFRRKKDSFERVIKGIELCKKYKIKVIINTVVHKGNLYTDGFRELLDFADREKILVNTLLAKGVGGFKDCKAMLDKEDLQAYMKIVEPYPYVQRHLNYNYGKQFGCPGTKEMINMTPYGDVMNCANMHIYFGNVLEEPLAVIRDRALKNTPFGRYHSCFLAEDQDFIKIYYSMLEKK